MRVQVHVHCDAVMVLERAATADEMMQAILEAVIANGCLNVVSIDDVESDEPHRLGARGEGHATSFFGGRE